MPRSIGGPSPCGEWARTGRQKRPAESADRGRELNPHTLPVHRIRGRGRRRRGEREKDNTRTCCGKFDQQSSKPEAPKLYCMLVPAAWPILGRPAHHPSLSARCSTSCCWSPPWCMCLRTSNTSPGAALAAATADAGSCSRRRRRRWCMRWRWSWRRCWRRSWRRCPRRRRLGAGVGAGVGACVGAGVVLASVLASTLLQALALVPA